MIWALLHHGEPVASGSYAQMLDTAEEWRVLERTYHREGIEHAPRWVGRGWAIVPAEMVRQVRRRAA